MARSARSRVVGAAAAAARSSDSRSVAVSKRLGESPMLQKKR